MIRRFQIEDLIVQDATGVVFRALDTESGKAVAVRRFFPFGADGGGLSADEQTAYNIAIARLAGISHPALRSVICGGCDPVDGMPFIATEWIDGGPLAGIPLPAEAAVTVIRQALEVCELLSAVLAEEAVWLETAAQSIIVGNPESGRGATFWISPLKWLGNSEENRGLESIIALTEELMGWRGQVVSDQAGRGLGGWLKWLRGAAATTTLHEAREMLAASVGEDPPAPAKALVVQATRRVRPSFGKPTLKQPSSKAPLIISLCLALAVAGFAAWFFLHRPSQTPEAAAGSPSSSLSDRLTRVNQRSAELSASLAAKDRDAAEVLAHQRAAADALNGVIQWNHRELLMEHIGKEVTVTGVLEKIEKSKSGKTRYLQFTKTPQPPDSRVGIKQADWSRCHSEQELQERLGSKIQVRGIVKEEKFNGIQRPVIFIRDRAALTFPE